MSEQSELTVPKDRQEVSVLLLNRGTALEGFIFLEYQPESMTIHERIVFFLEDTNSFFPLKLKNDAGTEFINKNNVKLLELRCPSEGAVCAPLGLMHIENVIVHFRDESSLSGALIAEVPLEKARLSDCLNLPDKFLNLKINNNISYVNKHAVTKVLYAPKP